MTKATTTDIDKANKLKPCPFCGSEVEEKYENLFYSLRCPNKDCYGGVYWVMYYDRDKLRKAWNRRAIDFVTAVRQRRDNAN